MTTSRDQQLTLIYRHMHRDFKGKCGDVRTILIGRNGATCLVPLSDLTDAEISDRLPVAQRKQDALKAHRAAKESGL